MKIAYLLALGLTGLLAAVQVQATQIYTWVDDNGVTHFSERPPKNVKASIIRPKTGHSEPVNYDNPATTEASPAPTAQARANPAPQAANRDPERCEQARKNLETLQNFGRIRIRADDGSFHYLTEEEREQRLQETQTVINQEC